MYPKYISEFTLYARQHFGAVGAGVSNIGKIPHDPHASVFYIFVGAHLFSECVTNTYTFVSKYVCIHS